MVKPAREPRRRLPTVQETSSGGLVVDLSTGVPRAAVICRLNRAGRQEWCLPKGHLEGEETLEEAAVREIEEETGIRGEIVEDLGSIDYWFSADGRRIHKVVHLFLLKATGGTLTVENDPDAEAIDVEWIAFSDLDARLAFPNERRAALAATALLGELA
ncbi:NUDIX hydrolase [Kineococcus sp. NBC_00420]|uniref:NUDIX hydrolase n=1 Tax=unclassified Kineococcus TaxID=2621656 RepID=UPI002E1AC448